MATETDRTYFPCAPVADGAPASAPRIHIHDHFPKPPAQLFGRDEQLAGLNRAWSDAKTHALSVVAWGGAGKSALVAKWLAQLAAEDHRGAEAVFAWSFYSQGTQEQGAASADQFIAHALTFFGDADPTQGSPHDRGERLAGLVGGRQTLLVLDGLEPLQHPPGAAGRDGELKDPALQSLLTGLARHNPGLCVVTTRESVKDLEGFVGTTVVEWKLERLSPEAGLALLRRWGVKGPDGELRKACAEVQGHALTLELLARFLAGAHGGDIRKRDVVSFQEADNEIQGGHAFRVLDAYERWLLESGEAGKRQVAVLRLLGLFDRPADPGCLAALRADPPIPGLTEPLTDLTDAQWNLTLSRLEEAGLVTHTDWHRPAIVGYDEETARKQMDADRRRASGPLEGSDPIPPTPLKSAIRNLQSAFSTDAHPLLRERFARHLAQENPKGWRQAHRRLYEHLKDSVPYWPEGLDGLQPLYQAVAHGCQAGLQQQACVDAYRDRILRGTGSGGFYSWKKLGAFGAELGAVACFFETPWRKLSPNLSEADQAWLLAVAGFDLRALGRLTEAVEPMRAGMELGAGNEHWLNAAIGASNLSELELTVGEVSAAVTDGEQAATFADRSGDAFQRMINRTTHADALHQAGGREEALRLFREAEAMQAEDQPEYPRLYSLPGFRYCDLLLAEAERAAWRVTLARVGPAVLRSPDRNTCSTEGLPEGVTDRSGDLTVAPVARSGDRATTHKPDLPACLATCAHVAERAAEAMQIAERNNWLLDIALDHLTLARAALYQSLLTGSPIQNPQSQIQNALEGLRQAGRMDHLPRGLLTRAWLRFVAGDEPGCRADLDEAWEIAERGPMPLHMADIQLTRARLFRDKAALAEARRLIRECRYHRRDGELADAEEAAEQWPAPEPDPASTPASTADPVRGSGIAPTPGTRSPAPLKETTVMKTIVELDLIGYSDKARELQENLGAEVVMQLNEQIQGLVDAGLDAAGVPRDQALLADTGDGGMLLFDEAATAHRFAQAAHRACEAHNRDTTVASAQRWFRIGIATGEVAMKVEAGTRKVAGIVLSNVVRLETAGSAGHILIDAVTYGALPDDTRRDYVGPEEVTGKRNERFQVYRCIVTGPAPGPAAPTVVSVLDLFDALNPRDQLTRVMLILGMPQEHRPSETLTVAQRQDRILDWACGRPAGLKALDEALRSLIEKQNHPQ
jgi:tetratricopeptide (TPR) repeat protein